MLESVDARIEAVSHCGLIHRVHQPQVSSEGNKPPLFVLVHGRAGNAKVMWVFSRALEKTNPIVVSPQAFVPDEIGGHSWWDTSPNTPKATEPILHAAEVLENFIEKACTYYGADRERVYAVGFSQGAALIATLSFLRPELVKGVAMLSGFIPRKIEEHVENINLTKTKTPYFLYHGTKDEVIPFSRAEETVSFLKKLHADVTFFSEDVAHKVGSAGIRELEKWIVSSTIL